MAAGSGDAIRRGAAVGSWYLHHMSVVAPAFRLCQGEPVRWYNPPPMHNSIIIKGAREHNLKNIDVEIPRDKLVVITGLSGSGKSSLAFDTIYAEGQRRYVESLSAYARQFLEQMGKPDVDSIEGLSPAISIEQKSTSHNPRSTVGTVTEIYDYLRLLFARVGRPSCFQCGEEITAQTVQQMVDAICALPEGRKFQILAPIVRGRKGNIEKNCWTCAGPAMCGRGSTASWSISGEDITSTNRRNTRSKSSSIGWS